MSLPTRLVSATLAAASALLLAHCGDEPAGPPEDGGGDREPPVVRILRPSDGATVFGPVSIAVEATDASPIRSVSVSVLDSTGAAVLARDLTAPPFELTWRADSVAAGPYRICAEAKDAFDHASAAVCHAVRTARRPVVRILRPFDGATVFGPVSIAVEATDASAIRSVNVSVLDSLGTAVLARELTIAPYEAVWRADSVVAGTYRICASALDTLGQLSTQVCHAVRVSRTAKLVYDDGGADTLRFENRATWQTAAVFANPFDVPARVAEVEFFIHGATVLGAPFRFVLWNAPGGRPSSEIEGTPTLAIRDPRDAFGYYEVWSAVVPARGTFAAGMQQLSTDFVALGHDTTRPFRAGTFFASSPAGSSTWASYEALGFLDIPMIRVTLEVATGERTAIIETGGKVRVGYGLVRGTRDSVESTSAGGVVPPHTDVTAR